MPHGTVHGKNFLIRQPAYHGPPDGVVLNALAFSTLLSSQGTDAHLRKAFAFLGGFVFKAYPVETQPPNRLSGSIQFLTVTGPGPFSESAFGFLPDVLYVTGIPVVSRIGGTPASPARTQEMSSGQPYTPVRAVSTGGHYERSRQSHPPDLHDHVLLPLPEASPEIKLWPPSSVRDLRDTMGYTMVSEADEAAGAGRSRCGGFAALFAAEWRGDVSRRNAPGTYL
jgi:hypothetical protein